MVRSRAHKVRYATGTHALVDELARNHIHLADDREFVVSDAWKVIFQFAGEWNPGVDMALLPLLKRYQYDVVITMQLGGYDDFSRFRLKPRIEERHKYLPAARWHFDHLPAANYLLLCNMWTFYPISFNLSIYCKYFAKL